MEYCPFSHHSARYNLCRILMEMVLLEDHYVNVPCLDCISKHLMKIAAYAGEGLNLDEAGEWREWLVKAFEIARRHMEEVARLLGVKGEEVSSALSRLAQELRAYRRELTPRLLGFHDIEHRHAHEHKKEGGAEGLIFT
jgi:hypothetical protein